jgi:hypothetical protein
MHLDLLPATLEKVKQLSAISGVLKKKREKGTVAALLSASEEKWFCFRGAGRFFVHYQDKKKPVIEELNPGHRGPA